MAIELQRLVDVHLGFVESHHLATRLARSGVSVAAGVVARGMLVGVGVGTLALTAGSAQVASVTVLGVLALGAALLSWDP